MSGAADALGARAVRALELLLHELDGAALGPVDERVRVRARLALALASVLLARVAERGGSSAAGAGSVGALLEHLRAHAGQPGDEAWARLLEAARVADVPGQLDARVGDATVLEVLELLLADAEALELEDIGSVYETLMDYEVERASGSLVLAPGTARRRSGAHYTPRALTEPVVRVALEPVLAELGPKPRPQQLLAVTICDPAMGSGAFLLEACRQLARALVEAWRVHEPARARAREAEQRARALIVARCVYGVDKDPLAVELARRSLALLGGAALGPGPSALDHALRRGDSLIGLTREQIAACDWRPEASSTDPVVELDTLSAAEARLVGDAVIAALFSSARPRAAARRRAQLCATLRRWREGDAAAEQTLREAARALRDEHGVWPFHWPLELPELFGPGFCVVVGNPPYAGAVQSGADSKRHTQVLRALNPGAGGKTDLVAFFVRRCHALARPGATIGLVATNTVAQGDTRDSGLAHVVEDGGWIYAVQERVPWPGAAVVVATTIHLRKGVCRPAPLLDGVAVPRISAFLLGGGPDRNPPPIPQPDVGLATKGVVPYGMGFVFEDGKQAASALAELDELLARCPAARARIKRFLGGADLNRLPDHRPERFIIDVNDLSEAELAREWPALHRHLLARVRPAREALTTQSGAAALKQRWWCYGYNARELRAAMAGMPRVLVTSQTSKYRAFAWCPAKWLFDQKVIVFCNAEHAFFAILQARVHVIWAQFIGSTMKDDPVYTPSDCLASFPFPDRWRGREALERLGRAYHEARAALMARKREGLTKIYNRFHDPDEHDAQVRALRELHGQLDRAVLEAYGWGDLAARARCEFMLEYDAPGSRIAPWRYKWADELRDEVLTRLLERNGVLAGRSDAQAG